jgi:hypothetical protein
VTGVQTQMTFPRSIRRKKEGEKVIKSPKNAFSSHHLPSFSTQMSSNNSTYSQSPATIFDDELSEDDSDVSDIKHHGSDEEMDDNKSKKEPTFDEKNRKRQKSHFSAVSSWI